MMGGPALLKLTAKKRAELEATMARSSAPAGHVRRARVVLLSADGVSGSEIAGRLDLTPEAVSRIRRGFREQGVGGLAERQRSGRKDNRVPAATARDFGVRNEAARTGRSDVTHSGTDG